MLSPLESATSTLPYSNGFQNYLLTSGFVYSACHCHSIDPILRGIVYDGVRPLFNRSSSKQDLHLGSDIASNPARRGHA